MNDHSLIAKTRRQIADEYGISPRTLKRRCEKNGIDLPSGLIYPKDILLIYKKLGWPRKRG